jgi:glyoxylase-like metal-dependent hydrolase (beta-lactamase superfamily II)
MSSSLDYPFADLPAAGIALPVAEGVDWLRMSLPFALDHINLWLLADGDAHVAVDTGYALVETRAAWKSALAGRRLGDVVVTHCHPDHLGNAAWLEQEYAAPLSITQGEYLAGQMISGQVGGYGIPAMLAFFRRHGLDADRIDALEQRGNAYKKGVPAIPASYRRLFDGQVLSIGSRAWRVIVGYGHAPEHASLYCAELGVLISGDMLLPRISTNVPVLATNPLDNPLQWFLDSIDRFRALPADTLVLPSHGRPFRGLHARIDQLHAHHDGRCALLRTACATPKTAAELIPVLFEREIPDPHQTMFAMGEAIAHLNLLEHRGELRRIVEADDAAVTRFVCNPDT